MYGVWHNINTAGQIDTVVMISSSTACSSVWHCVKVKIINNNSTNNNRTRHKIIYYTVINDNNNMDRLSLSRLFKTTQH